MSADAEIDGRVVDLDSHEMMPANQWGAYFGVAGERLATLMSAPMDDPRGNSGGVRSSTRNSVMIEAADASPITPESVWTEKGCVAPGAFDLDRRASVLDAMGVDAQLVFPGVGFIGFFVAANAHEEAVIAQLADPRSFDAARLGTELIRAHNDWATRAAADQQRLRVVGMVVGDTVDELVESASALVDGGVRALWFSSGSPPADLSPADPRLDPLWQVCEQASVPLVLHAGTSFSFLRSPRWGRSEQFVPDSSRFDEVEFTFEPFVMSTLHLAEEHVVTAMILGGVFDRCPRLRLGVIECGASWVGPLAERLDFWVERFENPNVRRARRPSEVIRDQIRVTPFWAEPVELWIERYALPEVYAFSTDYPHLEGGMHSRQRFLERLDPLGPDVVERFFVTNGRWLLDGEASAR